MDEEDEHFLSASHQKCILLSGTECHIINYLPTELARLVRRYSIRCSNEFHKFDRIYSLFTSLSFTYMMTSSHAVGLIDQLVEHCTRIAEV